MPALYPTTIDLAELSLTLYQALDAVYPCMPAEEQRLLRHTMLDQTRPWEAMATNMPTLHVAIKPETFSFLGSIEQTLSDALFAPAIVWGLTQDWVPNQYSMIETILNKWSAEHVHNEDLHHANVESHIYLMRMFHLLMQQLPFEVDPLVYARLFAHAKETRRIYDARSYKDDTAGVWLQWLARTAVCAADAIENELGSPAHDVWSNMASSVFGQMRFGGRPSRVGYLVFEHVLNSTLPSTWRLLTLREADAEYWLSPQFVPRLQHLLSGRSGQRILEIPWCSVRDEDMKSMVIHCNNHLAQLYLPDMYPALYIMLKDDVWTDQILLVQALLASVFSTSSKTLLNNSVSDCDLFEAIP